MNLAYVVFLIQMLTIIGYYHISIKNENEIRKELEKINSKNSETIEIEKDIKNEKNELTKKMN